jgi:glycosyltransferase involved in cell wall biosynthesis
MRIAYITTYNARDIKVWSGTGYFIWKSLADRGIEVELVCPLTLPAGVRLAVDVRRRYYARVGKKMYVPDHDLIVSRAYSKQAGSKLRALSRVDAVISPGTIPVAFLPGKVPLVTISDATHRLLFGTYPAYRNLSRLNHRHGDQIELNACRRAAGLVFSSQWAADSAIRDYGADPAKVHVVPFGANLENPPSKAVVEQAIEARDRRQMRLLFIGVEWERKGGPAALEVARHLNKTGIPTQLTVMGCSPEIANADRAFVTVQGFISKGGDGQRRIQEEMARSHFLIVPSTAECYGMVYCEASSVGVPSIAKNVGGVATSVQNGRNGRLFDPKESPVLMADWMAAIFRDYDAYRRLALSAFGEYEARLNWKVAAASLEKILRRVLSSAKT